MIFKMILGLIALLLVSACATEKERLEFMKIQTSISEGKISASDRLGNLIRDYEIQNGVICSTYKKSFSCVKGR